MRTLTEARVAQVTAILEKSFLTSAGYEVNLEPKDNRLIFIRPKDFPQYFIRLDLVKDRQNILAASQVQPRTYLESRETPGEYINEQDVELSEFSSFLSQLNRWCERVRQAILAAPNAADQLRDRFREDVDKMFSNVSGDQTARFTEEEKAEIFKRLDELETKYEAALSAQGEQQEEIARSRRVVEDLKAAAETLPKWAWLRTFGYQLAVFATSKAGQAWIGTAVKAVLGHHGFEVPHGGLLENLSRGD